MHSQEVASTFLSGLNHVWHSKGSSGDHCIQLLMTILGSAIPFLPLAINGILLLNFLARATPMGSRLLGLRLMGSGWGEGSFSSASNIDGSAEIH
ncbi:hypothetical protein [Microtetraspora malaysiensis]|uniref:hypothetical protein n=1 Tax=Microtetraspora malaysiensis TaxID=161358 RepID=UPI0012F96D11|nr:hypothetical protein [Microtetraspora malaysiensis]